MTYEELAAIVEQYEKHAWTLRRVLVPLSSIEIARKFTADRQEARIIENEHAAIWFSRRSITECESWELRRIAPPAYAVVEVIPDDSPQEAKDELLSRAEARMFSKDP